MTRGRAGHALATVLLTALLLPAAVRADDSPVAAGPAPAPRSLVVALGLADPALQAGVVRGRDVILARGFEVELARILARRLGGKVERFVYVSPPARLLAGSGAAGWDLALAGIEPSQGAGAAAELSVPYLTTDVAVVARRGLARPRRLADLRHALLCAVRGGEAARAVAVGARDTAAAPRRRRGAPPHDPAHRCVRRGARPWRRGGPLRRRSAPGARPGRGQDRERQGARRRRPARDGPGRRCRRPGAPAASGATARSRGSPAHGSASTRPGCACSADALAPPPLASRAGASRARTSSERTDSAREVHRQEGPDRQVPVQPRRPERPGRRDEPGLRVEGRLHGRRAVGAEERGRRGDRRPHRSRQARAAKSAAKPAPARAAARKPAARKKR